MDIFAHSLWTNALARKGNDALRKKGKPEVNLAWATFFGVFPDLFAFGLPFVLLLARVLVGQAHFQLIFANRNQIPGLSISHNLYQYSHSKDLGFDCDLQK